MFSRLIQSQTRSPQIQLGHKKKHRQNPFVQSSPHLGDWVIKRLDRIYYCESSRGCPFSLSSTILPNFYLSNHAPVLGTLKTQGIAIRPSLYRVYTNHLKEKGLLDKLTPLWEEIKVDILGVDTMDGPMIEKLFFKGLYESKKITRAYGKEKAKKR